MSPARNPAHRQALDQVRRLALTQRCADVAGQVADGGKADQAQNDEERELREDRAPARGPGEFSERYGEVFRELRIAVLQFGSILAQPLREGFQTLAELDEPDPEAAAGRGLLFRLGLLLE